jgi:cbb3-type cytochrome oxidase subunit 3
MKAMHNMMLGIAAFGGVAVMFASIIGITVWLLRGVAKWLLRP